MQKGTGKVGTGGIEENMHQTGKGRGGAGHR